MRTVLQRLRQSLTQITDVADDMDTRMLSAPPPVRLRDETLRCACTVILSGFFETFLKEIAEVFVGAICSRNIPFTLLPQKIQLRHFVQGGQLLGQKAKNDSRASWVSSNYLDVARRLSSPAEPGPYSLVWEAFATTQGNPGPDVVESILEHLGVDRRQPRLDSAAGGSYATMRLQLQSFIAIRNECAHTGKASNVPTTGDIRGYCSLLDGVASAVVKVLEQRLAEAPFGMNLNSASAAELGRIPGVGGQRLAALIAKRAIQPFTQVEDLRHVSGFGPKMVEVAKLHLHV